MDLLAPFKRLGKKVSTIQETKKEYEDKQASLSKWVKKFEQAKSLITPDTFDDREAIVLGTRLVDRNINSGATPKKGANNIYNIAFEFIESQVNSQIPQPNVRSKRPGWEQQATMIEQSISNDLKELGIEQVNDYNERMTPLHGFSIMTLDWDPDFKHHLYRGEIKVNSKHPKQLIPQPGVYDVQKMDYFFIASGVTKEYIHRRYGIDIENAQQEYPEYNSLEGNARTVNQFDPKGLTPVSTSNYFNNDLLTEIVCWYRDKDGDVCKFVWTDTEVLEDLPKFYMRRMVECKKCDTKSPQGTTECPECGGKSFKTVMMEDQELDMEVTTFDGEVLPVGTKIPYFLPTKYPVIIRLNVPKSFSFEGQSDIDILRDQQDSIKKIGTKLEEKVVKASSILLVPETLKVNLTNEMYQIIKGNLADLSAIQTRELMAPINGEVDYINFQRQIAQQMLGITNSFQGLQDITATSGRAKQVQVQQAAGRLQSKLFNKITAYKELFERMFEFKLAFYDELRPFISKDANGSVAYGEFDKYQFLMRDAAGELYYCTDFLFSADSGDGLPKDPMFMYEQASIQLQQGLINKVQYWTILESLNYPNAASFKDEAQKEMEAAAQQPPPPSPEEIKAQTEMQKQQSQQEYDMIKMQSQQQFEADKIDIEHQNELEKQLLQANISARQQLFQGMGRNNEGR